MTVSQNIRVIEKKIAPEFFAEVVRGKKNFEIRKDEDEIAVGDILWLREWKVNGDVIEGYTGRDTYRRVEYVLRDYPGIESGYCIVSFSGRY